MFRRIYANTDPGRNAVAHRDCHGHSDRISHSDCDGYCHGGTDAFTHN
jgi:hypothetical protein